MLPKPDNPEPENSLIFPEPDCLENVWMCPPQPAKPGKGVPYPLLVDDSQEFVNIIKKILLGSFSFSACRYYS